MPGSAHRFRNSAGCAIPAAAPTLPVVVIIAPTLLLMAKHCHLASYLGVLSLHGCRLHLHCPPFPSLPTLPPPLYQHFPYGFGKGVSLRLTWGRWTTGCLWPDMAQAPRCVRFSKALSPVPLSIAPASFQQWVESFLSFGVLAMVLSLACGINSPLSSFTSCPPALD